MSNELEKFAALIDHYIKENPNIQPDNKKYITIDLHELTSYADHCILSKPTNDLSDQKLKIIKEVLEL